MPFFVKPCQGIARQFKGKFVGTQIVQHLDYMNSELGATRLVCGAEFSAADVQMSFPLEACSGARRLMKNGPT